MNKKLTKKKINKREKKDKFGNNYEATIKTKSGEVLEFLIDECAETFAKHGVSISWNKDASHYIDKNMLVEENLSDEEVEEMDNSAEEILSSPKQKNIFLSYAVYHNGKFIGFENSTFQISFKTEEKKQLENLASYITHDIEEKEKVENIKVTILNWKEFEK